jgi:hypothetical protein
MLPCRVGTLKAPTRREPGIAAVKLMPRCTSVAGSISVRAAERKFFIAPRRCQFDAASAARKESGTDLVLKNPTLRLNQGCDVGSFPLGCYRQASRPRQPRQNDDDVVVPFRLPCS